MSYFLGATERPQHGAEKSIQWHPKFAADMHGVETISEGFQIGGV